MQLRIPIMNQAMCCGCRACELTCTKGAITMIFDLEGFLLPEFDYSKCIHCGRCEVSCPMLNSVQAKAILESPRVFAVQNKNNEILSKSSSGGVFSALADYVLALKGTIVGCIFNAGLHAIHVIAENSEEIIPMRGSKYVQSDTGNTYRQVRQVLEEDTYVLFAGTPCQVAGLRSYLQSDYKKLITVDIICHGVPSDWLFHEYLHWLEYKHAGKITEYNFRDKANHGWSTCGTYTITIEKKRKIKKTSSFGDYYYWLFETGAINRECCYHCKYACIQRGSDLTIADYWDIHDYHKHFDSTKGVSSLMCNTQKGIEIFNAIKREFHNIPSCLENIIKSNGNVSHSSPRPPLRDHIYSDVKQLGFEKAVKKNVKLKFFWPTIKQAIPHSIKKQLRYILRRNTK